MRIKWFALFSVIAFSVIPAFSRSDSGTHSSDRIHDEALTIDTHLDTPIEIVKYSLDLSVRHPTGKPKSGDCDFPRMKEGGLDAAFFAVYIRQDTLSESGYASALQKAGNILSATKQEILRHPDLAEIALSPDDAYRIEKQGKRAIFFGLENGYPIGTDLADLRRFVTDGIRYVTLCHTRHNQICDASTDKREPRWNGLSPFGKTVLAECNRLGVVVDVSHASDSAFWQVVRLTRKPFMASHSCCRALCDNPRNLSDDMLKAVARNNGVVQINLCSFYLEDVEFNPLHQASLDSLKRLYSEWSAVNDPKILAEYEKTEDRIGQRFPEDKASVADLVDHIDHAVRVAGIEHVGIGSDFDGGAGLRDLRDVSEMPRITEELLRRGYSEEAIRKIWGGNIMRVVKENIEGGRK
ncbi:MAG TPA: dipeptidase [bacterium]